MALRRDPAEVADDRLPDRLRLILQPDEPGGVEQLLQSGQLFGGEPGEQVVLDGHVRTDVTALGGEESVGIVVSGHRRHEGVDGGREGLPLTIGECGVHSCLSR